MPSRQSDAPAHFWHRLATPVPRTESPLRPDPSAERARPDGSKRLDVWNRPLEFDPDALPPNPSGRQDATPTLPTTGVPPLPKLERLASNQLRRHDRDPAP